MIICWIYINSNYRHLQKNAHTFLTNILLHTNYKPEKLFILNMLILETASRISKFVLVIYIAVIEEDFRLFIFNITLSPIEAKLYKKVRKMTKN